MVNQKGVQRLKNHTPFLQKTVMIAGGSKGIGLATAKLIAACGGNLCLIARNEEDLHGARDECQDHRVSEEQFVDIIACDTTDEAKLKPLIENYIAHRGVPEYLINVVGYAYPQYLEKTTLEDFRRNMDVNYYGQLVPMLILLPHFLKRGSGYYANVASLASIVGVIGYATYTPTKFAIVGLVEGFRHELKPYNIGFSLLYPPDTETPGYERENLTKPPECVEISKSGKLMQPEDVAYEFIRGILKHKFAIYPGEAKWIQFVKRHWPLVAQGILDLQLRLIRKKLAKKVPKK